MVTEGQKEALVQAAQAVRKLAYAPYSNYLVGAALLTEGDRIFTGVNVENASYGLTICAERTAVFKMVSEGVQRITAVAVCAQRTPAGEASPCGACRQVLVEFASDIPVYICDEDGLTRETTLYTLLPYHFGPEHLQSL